MKLMAIDPAWAKAMAYAIFEDSVLKDFGKSENIGKVIIDAGPDVVITERPYIGGNVKQFSHRGRANTFEKLCYAVGIIAGFAGYVGAKFQLARPVEWKSAFGLTKRNPPVVRAAIRHKLAGSSKNADVQDAIMIGRYYTDHVLVKEKA